MNQEQAKMLVELGFRGGWSLFSDSIFNNRGHIIAFSEVGKYQALNFDSQWVTYTDLCFEFSPDQYRPVPERKINWEKAMKNGAWDDCFLFGNRKLKAKLIGYDKRDPYPFYSTMGRFLCCEPLPGFDIPESWLEDVET